MGTETILDQRNLLLHYGLASECSEGHHVLVMSVANLLNQYFHVWCHLNRNIKIPNQIALCTDGVNHNIGIPHKTKMALEKFSDIPNECLSKMEFYVCDIYNVLFVVVVCLLPYLLLCVVCVCVCG